MLLHYDVLISAGHEGRPASCAVFHHTCNLGANGEREWTPIVADAVTRVLTGRGYTVARLPADFAGTYGVREAVFIHFDGAEPACSSAASVGYHTPASAPLAQAWRTKYGTLFPFGFKNDNFTPGLRDYYAYKQVQATDGAIVIELGELTCPPQKAWLMQHLRMLGGFIADFLDRRMRLLSGR